MRTASDRGGRQERTAPRPGRRIRLTERDRWIVESVGTMRFATTGQLARLHFEGSRWSANKGLRRLLDAGLLRTWVRDLSKENVYSLAPAGAKSLEEGGGSWPAPRGLDGNLDHLLAINQVRVALALGLPAIDGEIGWWRSDWDLRGEARVKVVPDGLFAIRWEAEGEQVFALEIENRTKSPQGFLRKALAYEAGRRLSLLGRLNPLVLVLGVDPAWLERYRLGAARASLGSRMWFAALPEFEEKGIHGAVWRSVEGEEASLRHLASLPYGKEASVPPISAPERA